VTGSRTNLRTGFTTGACAAAAATAAARALVTGAAPSEVELVLPNGAAARFAISRAEVTAARATCAVVKDGGDDPDATHGAEIVATVALRDVPGVELRRGPGVATVTKPGLGLELGAPAITPVPRRHIAAAVQAELTGIGAGAVVEISVPRGEELARATLNARLGLVGGISILGTTGIVRPFSAEAYGAAVARAVDVARAAGLDEVVFSTGARSEACAMRLHPGLPEEGFVQVGDCVGLGLRRAARRGFDVVRVFAMVGKLTKLAAGLMQTHASRGEVDRGLLAALAADAGAPAPACRAIAEAMTARGALEIAARSGAAERVAAALCRRAAERCAAHAGGALRVVIALVGFDGAVLAEQAEAAA
jgi:cobalt-precorrin-5B (C1)-methyltransferase